MACSVPTYGVAMLGVDRSTVIEEIDLDEESETVVVHVRPRRATKRRCGRCGVRAPGYDQGEGRRRWRALDLGTMQCFLAGRLAQGELPRARPDRRPGALGPPRCRPHPGLRRPGGLARHPHRRSRRSAS